MKKIESAKRVLEVLKKDFPETWPRLIGAAETGRTGFIDRVWQHPEDSSQYREEWVKLPSRGLSLARRFILRAGTAALL